MNMSLILNWMDDTEFSSTISVHTLVFSGASISLDVLRNVIRLLL